MAVGGQSSSVTSSTAVLLAAVPTSSFTGPVGSAVISNGSGGTVQVSGQGVTTSTGYPLAASTTITVTLYPGDAVYAIAASTTSVVSVLQT